MYKELIDPKCIQSNKTESERLIMLTIVRTSRQSKETAARGDCGLWTP